jgi:hypothetical protein
MCHYTTLQQELTLSPHDILYDAETAQNYHLESASDELVSSEDEVYHTTYLYNLT